MKEIKNNLKCLACPIRAIVAVVITLVIPTLAASPVKMQAILTVPHEFDMLLESGHIQGLACSESGIYLSHQEGIAKIDWTGKLIKHVTAPRHLGGIAYANGRIYGAFIIRDKKDMKEGKPGLLRVWDEELNQIREKSFQEAAGCLGILGDTIYYAVNHDKKPHRDAKIKRLGLDLSERGDQCKYLNVVENRRQLNPALILMRMALICRVAKLVLEHGNSILPKG